MFEHRDSRLYSCFLNFMIGAGKHHFKFFMEFFMIPLNFDRVEFDHSSTFGIPETSKSCHLMVVI